MKIISTLKKWFLRNFVCPSIFCDGHIPVKEVRETDLSITQYKCKRCDCTLGLGFWKFSHDIPPPNSTPEQIIKWKKFCEDHLNRLRQGITEYDL